MTRRIPLLPTQLAFLFCEDRTAGYGGGVGCGKTEMAGFFIAKQCMDFPGNVGIVASATSETLKMATIPKVHAVLDRLRIEYTYVEHKSRLYFPNGSWLKYQSLSVDDPNTLKGSEIGFLLVDETDACKEAYINVLIPRVRKKGTSREIRLIFNPPHPEHWLERWFQPSDDSEPMGTFFQASTYENFFLPEDYIQRLEKLHPPGTAAHDRFVLGKMGVTLENAMYPEYDPAKHLISREEAERFDFVGACYGLDLGHHNPTVLLRGRVTDDDVLVVDAEHCASGLTYAEHAEEFAKMYVRGPIFADHDAQGRYEIEQLGFATVAAFKEVTTGCNAVRQRIRDGRLLIVREACRNLRYELPRYHRQSDGEKPVKKDDHSCFTGDHEVLTPDGWVRFDELQDGVECLSVTSDGASFFEKPKNVIRKTYTGGMHEIDNHHNLSLCATDDHQHAVMRQSDWKRDGVWKLGKVRFDDLPKESYWASAPKSFPEGSGIFDSEDQAWLSGMWLADGCFRQSRPSLIVIDQKKEPWVSETFKRLDRAGYGYSSSKSAEGVVRFEISGVKPWATMLRARFNQHSYGKRVLPKDVMQMTNVERAAFWDGYMAGDGCRVNSSWHFDSVSEDLIDGIQFLTMTLGMGSNVYSCGPAGVAEIKGRMCNQRKSYRCSCRRSSPVAHIQRGRFREFDVKDMPVYCLTTSTGFFLARRNGKCFVAGNCDALRYMVCGLDIQSKSDAIFSDAIFSALSG